MRISSQEPAFPSTNNGDLGMSLRDWFAGQALIAVSSRWKGNISDIDQSGQELSARYAYQIADAMMKERAK